MSAAHDYHESGRHNGKEQRFASRSCDLTHVDYVAAHSLISSFSRWSSLISSAMTLARAASPFSSASFCSTYRSIRKSWISVILARSSGVNPSYCPIAHSPFSPRSALPTLGCYLGNTREIDRVPLLRRVLHQKLLVIMKAFN